METKIIKPIHFSLFSSQNTTYEYNGFPGGARGKESTCQYRRHRDMGLIPGLGRSPEEGNGNLLQYSCLGNPLDKGAWQATVHGVAKESDRT